MDDAAHVDYLLFGHDSFFDRLQPRELLLRIDPRKFFVNVDFTNHVALVAVVKHDDGGEEIVGGGRYVMLQPGRAEAAFTVVDQFQGRGLGTVLLRHLAAVAGGAGIHELVAEVLPDNTPMLEVFENSGFPLTSRREPGVVHVTLRLH